MSTNNYKYELLTSRIEKENFLDAVLSLGRFLMSRGMTEVELRYGWVPFIEDNEQGVDHAISLWNLKKILEEEEEQERIELGLTDIWFDTSEPRSSIRICNDSDLHVQTDDRQFLEQIGDMWLEFVPEIYLRTYNDQGEKGSFECRTLNGQWQEWTKD